MTKGRVASMVAKGSSKKRSRKEMEAQQVERGELKADEFGFIRKHKRLREDFSTAAQMLLDIREMGPEQASMLDGLALKKQAAEMRYTKPEHALAQLRAQQQQKQQNPLEVRNEESLDYDEVEEDFKPALSQHDGGQADEAMAQ